LLVISPNIVKQQLNIGMGWEGIEWNGACDELAKIAKPTLVITGTDDNAYQPHANSLIIAGKIPGAWFIQIKGAGHAVMSQYPDEINNILLTFLSTGYPGFILSSIFLTRSLMDNGF
jgi:pimeloyl-ACP methyl ester carboxylesterase